MVVKKKNEEIEEVLGTVDFSLANYAELDKKYNEKFILTPFEKRIDV